MATGRIGVTPTLRTRWSKQPTAGTTSLSGLDDNSVALVYDVGYEAVYRNGALLSRGNDYTATNGTTVTLVDATLAGDIIEILANQLVPLTNAISNGQFTAKGALLSATAASTPGVLTVGSNDQVLTADSTASTGLKWAAPTSAAKSWTNLVNGTAFSGGSITFSSLSGYDQLLILVRYASCNTASQVMQVQFNSDTGGNYRNFEGRFVPPSTYGLSIQNNDGDTGATRIGYSAWSSNTSSTISGYLLVDATNSTGVKTYTYASGVDPAGGSNGSSRTGGGFYVGTSVISSITFSPASGSFNGGTVYIYGGK